MRKYFFYLSSYFVLTILFLPKSNAQEETNLNNCTKDISKIFFEETYKFIDSINEKDGRSKIFVIIIKDFYFYYGRLHMAISYSKDYQDIKLINPNYYFYYKNNLVITRIYSSNPKYSIEKLNLKKFSEIDTTILTKILDPSRSITGVYSGLMIIYDIAYEQIRKLLIRCPDDMVREITYYDYDKIYFEADSSARIKKGSK